MKVAEMKVFWNGSLRPLEQCTDDKIVGQKLEVILKSHEKLWSIRCFLNPDYLGKEKEVINACEYLFIFAPTTKKRYEQLYFKSVVDNIVRSEGLAEGMLHKYYEEKASGAIHRMAAQTAVLRDKDTVRKIVRDAFTT